MGPGLTARELIHSGYGQLELFIALTVVAALLAVVLPLLVERVFSRGY